MNARFRIGNVYEFKNINDNYFISESKLEYQGFTGNKRQGTFHFKFKRPDGSLGYKQVLDRTALEVGMVAGVTEWNKGDTMKDILERRLDRAIRYAEPYKGLTDGSYEKALESRGYYVTKKALDGLNA